MGSGSGHGQPTFLEAINEFVLDAARGLEGITLKELTDRDGTPDGEHSWDKTTGYSFRFRGLPVTLTIEKPDLVIDGVRVGTDVDPQLFARLKDACAERLVFQTHEKEMAARQADVKQTQAKRQEKYGPLVRRLRKAKAAHRRK